MSSGGALPPTSFNPFPYLFPTQPHFFTPNQRIKMKRQRQRVDAGEPRNSYQQPRVPPKQENGSSTQQATAIPLNVNQLFPSWMQAVHNLSDEKVEPEEGTHSIVESHENEMNGAMEDAPVSNASATESTSSSTSSSSRRKNNAPQKNSPMTIKEKEEELEEEEEETAWSTTGDLNHGHTDLYSAIIQQHKEAQNPEHSEISRLADVLKKEIMSSISCSIDKIITDWLTNERKRGDFPSFSSLSSLPSLLTQSTSAHTINPFSAATNSIFPPPFHPFLGGLNANVMKEEGSRKRKLEMPSVRSKMTASPSIRDHSPSSDEDISPVISGPTPLSSYFSSSMIGLPLYDMMESPFDSDEDDAVPYDPSMPQSCTLTPMHLRKAKLMFFFTRYPNSSLLKQFFPDIRFNKNNTAQLVKWFSNFREFYYNQMDKYAKQTVAEGIQKREDIIVTRESEIFKQLNQHYNRNNHIHAPDRLVWVVQESLREFYDAIKLGRHNEPSWKKQIYKIICRLDDPIPEYFKDPNFIVKLE